MVVDSAVANSPSQATRLTQRRNRVPTEQPAALPTARPLMLVPTHSNAPVTPLVLTSPRQWIGSDNSCEFHLHVPGIAARHALILLNSHQAAFRSWDHRTWLNGYPTQQGKLKPGDELTIGPIQFRVETPLERDLIEHLPAIEAIDASPIPTRTPTTTTATSTPTATTTANEHSQPEKLSPEARELATHLEHLQQQIDDHNSALLELLDQHHTESDAPAADSSEIKNPLDSAAADCGWLLRELVLREQQQDVQESSTRIETDLRQIEHAQQELQQARDSFETQSDQRKQEFEELETRLTERDTRLAAAEVELQQRQQELRRQEEASETSRIQIEAQRSQLEAQQVEFLKLQEQVTDQQSRLENEQRELSIRAERLAEHERDVERRREQVDQQQCELEQRERLATQLAADQQAIREELDNQQALLANQSQRSLLKLTNLRQMLEDARDELEQERQRFASEQSLSTTLVEQLQAKSSGLEAREQELQTRFEQFAESETELNEQLQQVRQQVAELEDQKQSLEQAAAAIKSRQKELDEHEASLAQQQAEATEQTKADADPQRMSEEEVKRARGELAELQQRLSDEQQSLQDERTQLEQMREGISQAAEQLRQQRDELRAAQLELQSLPGPATSENAEANGQSEAELAQIAAERRELDQQAARIAELQRSVAAQQEQLSQAREELDSDHRELQRHRYEIERRGQLSRLAECNLRAWQDELTFAAEQARQPPSPTPSVAAWSADSAADAQAQQRLQEREQELATLQATLEQQMAEFELQGGELIELKRELDQRFDDVDQRAAEIMEQQQSVEERRSELQVWESRLKQQETQLEEALVKLEQRQQELDATTQHDSNGENEPPQGSSIAAMFGITDADRSRLEGEAVAPVQPEHAAATQTPSVRDESPAEVNEDSLTGESECEEDVDIQAYMLRLLSENNRRLRPTAEPEPAAGPTSSSSVVDVDPDSDISHEGRTTDLLEAELEHEQSEASLTASRQRSRLKPEVSEEVARADLKNLRDVANASARMAVTSSTRKRVRMTLITRTALLVITGSISAGIVALRLWTNTVLMFIGWSCGVVSLVCLYELWMGLMQIRRAKKMGRLQDPSFDPYRQTLSSRLTAWILRRLPSKRDRSE